MVSPISAKLRPSDALMRQLGRLGQSTDPAHVKDVCKALDDYQSVEALAALLDEGIGATIKPGGGLDMKDLAAFLLRRLKESQR